MFRSTRPHPSRFRRGKRSGVALAGAVALTAAMVIVPASSASAATQPVTIATSVNGVLAGGAYAGESTTASFQVTNGSATTAKLAAFSIVVPKGVTAVTKAGVSLANWTQTLLPCFGTANCSAIVLLTANPRFSQSAVPPGASVTTSIKFTPTAPGTLTFPFIGIGGGIFKVAAYPTIVVGTHAATSITITSIADTSGTPPLASPVVGGAFAVSFTAKDLFGNPAQDTYALTATNSNGGTLTTLSSSPGVINASYSAVQNGLILRVSSAGAYDEEMTDVVTAGVSADAVPGTPASLLLPGVGAAGLPKGANGPISLTVQPCTPAPGNGCGAQTPVEIVLSGNFKDDSGEPLYTNYSPASMSWTCTAMDCPRTTGPHANYRAQDNIDYPTYMALKLQNGNYGDFSLAVPCVSSDDTETTGHIVTEEAQAKGFCVDVNAISRASYSTNEGRRRSCDPYYGDLTVPILFVEDPKMRHAP